MPIADDGPQPAGAPAGADLERAALAGDPGAWSELISPAPSTGCWWPSWPGACPWKRSARSWPGDLAASDGATALRPAGSRWSCPGWTIVQAGFLAANDRRRGWRPSTDEIAEVAPATAEASVIGRERLARIERELAACPAGARRVFRAGLRPSRAGLRRGGGPGGAVGPAGQADRVRGAQAACARRSRRGEGGMNAAQVSAGGHASAEGPGAVRDGRACRAGAAAAGGARGGVRVVRGGPGGRGGGGRRQLRGCGADVRRPVPRPLAEVVALPRPAARPARALPGRGAQAHPNAYRGSLGGLRRLGGHCAVRGLVDRRRAADDQPTAGPDGRR
jgi:hypothetical protein